MTVLKQIGVVLVGLVLAGVMVTLGVWQLNVYNAQGREQAQQRAAMPPIPLGSVARPGQEVGDGYGRTVRFTGRYDPSLQTFIAIADRPGQFRVLTALRLPDGGALPVVRGVVTGRRAPAAPSGEVTQTGVLLPSEGTDRQAAPQAAPSTVALASLAQSWAVPLVNGYVTLDAGEARRQGLAPASVALPSSHGRLRNGFYALQWWVFAGFAVLMGVRMARDLGRASNPDPDDELPQTPQDGSDAGAVPSPT